MKIATHRRRLLLLCTLAALALLVGCKAKSDDDSATSTKTPAPQETATTETNNAAVPDDGETPTEGDDEQTAKAAPKIEVLSPDDPRIQADLDKRNAEQRDRLAQVPLDQPLTNDQLKTTTCSIFLNNLKSQINSTKKLLASKPDDANAALQHAARVYGWGQLMGDLDTMAEAHQLVTAALERHPDHAGLPKTRARIAMTLHRFDEAVADLDTLAALPDAPTDQIQAMRDELELESGVGVEAHLAKKLEAYTGGTYDDFIASAQAREARGEVSLAQRLYGKAERNFKDVSPIPLAWLNVQRGLMAMHSGDFDAAQTFFAAGYARCPEYPMAAEHLAEIEGRLGKLERATELYEGVIEQTNNPEFMAALADVHLERGNKDVAEELNNRADQRFRELLERHPSAVSGHAADFFLGAGNDPALALEMLERNHTLRPNAHAKQALAEALLANDRVDDASARIDEALASPVEFAEKHWTAARIAMARNDDAAAQKHAARARQLNPRIAELEGELAEADETTPDAPTPQADAPEPDAAPTE